MDTMMPKIFGQQITMCNKNTFRKYLFYSWFKFMIKIFHMKITIRSTRFITKKLETEQLYTKLCIGLNFIIFVYIHI